MLSQKHRLSKSAEVKKTTAKGRSFFNPNFVIKFIPGEQLARITVVVSTKVSKKAVDRNRIKRVIRDELKKYIDQIKPGDYAFLVKQNAIKVTSQNLRESIGSSLKSSKSI
jgi:ribonuclease P protein component